MRGGDKRLLERDYFMLNLHKNKSQIEKFSRRILIAVAMKRRRVKLRPHFDENFYRFCYGDVIQDGFCALDHYMSDGCIYRFDPNPDFSTCDYIEEYLNLCHDGDALYDYLRSGKAAGRTPRPSRLKIEYFTAQQFDADYYLASNADVRGEWASPLKHYIQLGWREGRDPNPQFSTRYYLDRYVDARESGVNPLYHYVQVGRHQGRQSSPGATPGLAYDPRKGADAVADGHLDSVFSRLLHGQPDFATKWLKTNYLATGLSEVQRARCFMFHYQFVMDVFGEALLDDLFFRSFEIWSQDIDGARHRIVLKQARPSLVEGELSLEFQVDEVCLYTLSFTITPADLSGVGTEAQVLVSRLQGTWGLWPQIKQATRRMKDVAPGFALMAALQGLASAAGIDRLGGVSAQHQSARASTYKSDFDLAYDQFFRSLGAEPLDAMLFSASLPLAEKPMSEVKPGHRIRTRKKRAIKQAIAQAVEIVVRERLCRPAPLIDAAHTAPIEHAPKPASRPAAPPMPVHAFAFANDAEIPAAPEAVASA
jgi:uncharacterized protein VirK/YbjX